MCVCAKRERLNEIFPSGLIMLPLRTIDHLTKPPAPSMKSRLFSYWSGLLSRDSQNTLQVTAVALGFLLVEEGKSLFQKTPSTSDTGPRERPLTELEQT